LPPFFHHSAFILPTHQTPRPGICTFAKLGLPAVSERQGATRRIETIRWGQLSACRGLQSSARREDGWPRRLFVSLFGRGGICTADGPGLTPLAAVHPLNCLPASGASGVQAAASWLPPRPRCAHAPAAPAHDRRPQRSCRRHDLRCRCRPPQAAATPPSTPPALGQWHCSSACWRSLRQLRRLLECLKQQTHIFASCR
jgi:hypothetical protein